MVSLLLVLTAALTGSGPRKLLGDLRGCCRSMNGRAGGQAKHAVYAGGIKQLHCSVVWCTTVPHSNRL